MADIDAQRAPSDSRNVIEDNITLPSREDKPGADKPDRFGEELADDARIWRIYGQVAKNDDREKVQRWNGGLNNLALFAALFSGITTTFIVQSQNDLKPDFVELSYRVLNATASGRTYVEAPFTVPGSARLVNCLWVASLLFSLSAALIAIMGQDWIEMYVDRPVCNPRQWAEIRTFRVKGVELWYMPGVIASAPVLLHISLFLFGIGLVVFMAMDTLTQRLCLGLCCITAFLYSVITFSPVFWSTSPFRSPATELMRRWLCATFRPTMTDQSHSPHAAAEATEEHAVAGHVDAARVPDLTHQSRSLADSSILRLLIHAITAASGAIRRTNIPVSTDLAFAANVEMTAQPSVEDHDGLPGLPGARRRYHLFAQLQLPEKVVSAGSRTCGWLRDYFSSALRSFMRLLFVYGPDLSEGWTDVPKHASSARIADSLAWLYSASSAPSVMRAVATALGDLIIGEKVANEDVLKRIFELIRKDIESNLERPSLLELSRYVLVARNLRLSVRSVPILRRFDKAVRSGGPLSEDSFRAMAYLTDDFMLENIEDRLLVFDSPTIQRVCESIPVCSPITLSSIVSSLQMRHDGSSTTRSSRESRAIRTALIIMNRWRDALPGNLDKVAAALGAMVPGVDLHVWPCKSHGSLPSAAYKIIHILISVAQRTGPPDLYATGSAVDILLHLLRIDDAGEHPCVIDVFGNNDSPDIVDAAWKNRRTRDIKSLLLHTGVLPRIPYHLQSRQKYYSPISFARMLVRCLIPPYPLLDAKAEKNWDSICREKLSLLVADMAGDTPLDVVQALMQRSILVDLSKDRSDQVFWSIMTGLVHIICKLHEYAIADTFQESLGMFVSHLAKDDKSPAWNLADAIGTALTRLDAQYIRLLGGYYDHAHWSEVRTYDFASVLRFLAALRNLRELVPENALWEDIARSVGTESSKWKTFESEVWCRTVHEATGVDPVQFAEEKPSRDETWPFEFFANLPEEVYESGEVKESDNLP